jgi:flagella basal body P-ring formation protein FlgA
MRRAAPSLLFGLLLGLSALAIASPALAVPVELRSDVSTEGGRITLGDLFDGAGKAAGVLVATGQPGATVVLDANRVQMQAQTQGLQWANDRGLRRIIVQAGDAPAPKVQTAAPAASGKRPAAAQTLTFIHNLEAGDVVQAQDLSWSKTADAPLDAPRDPDAVIGMAARHPIREGAAVSMHDVAAPQVIKKDDMISVSFNMNGMVLTLQAKAMGDAVTGQPVTVMNPTSKKVLQAVAVGPGQAVVGPEADQLRAKARSSLSHLASR